MNQLRAQGSPAEVQEFSRYIDETNLRDTQEVFLSVGARCFAPCVTTFTSAELDRKEKTCITNCAKRFFEFHSRANARLAEENAAQQGQ